ncbi:hypothetical protein KR093_008993 [Drosophila rubida]|uniref:Uncharacterized protein n=1 Tax=Drosophila rubida TaxID=30044 RepID=A0AAD4PJQ1_9MUSC|nr:hypothetical protein KR093_008993 [Drosophila rubida]
MPTFDSLQLTLLLVILASCLLSTCHGYCSLEKMKTFAREACERLFQQDEGRERRSIGYNHHRHANELSHAKSHKHEHFIGRSSFPKGGYLKVSKAHYNRLVNLDVKPRYKPRKHPEMKSRFRRDNSIQAYKGISYCCYHQCDEEFFC